MALVQVAFCVCGFRVLFMSVMVDQVSHCRPGQGRSRSRTRGKGSTYRYKQRRYGHWDRVDKLINIVEKMVDR